MRSLWKGAISFGLVNIPISMYAATEDKSIKFNYLHRECNTPIKYQKTCPRCQREVPAEEIVRGYEYEPGKYVILTEEELDGIPGETTKTIDIIDFVNLAEIDPVYYNKTYYLEPHPGGHKAYALLQIAMTEANRIAIAKLVIRSKQSLAALRVQGKTLILETMFFPDEVRSHEQLAIPNDVSVHPNEVKMAISLISSLSASFDPGKYTDDYREALWRLIKNKAEGQEVYEAPTLEEPEKVVDLLKALEESLKVVQEEQAAVNTRRTL
ncbi:MAG: Ku protein [Limnochordia bacterium]|nr:Ku protein [Limnochordia bacterium]MDD2629695.1 Ku protein [Limnochordia bacterium]MDD4517034.1 Ku protein [Limnochordia bacterium]